MIYSPGNLAHACVTALVATSTLAGGYANAQAAQTTSPAVAATSAAPAPVLSGDEALTSFTLPGGVRVAVQSPAQTSAERPDHLVLYLLPNGNVIEQAMGRSAAAGLDFRYGSQQIAAQTRRVRQLLPGLDITTAYLQADTKSWPAWRRDHADANARIRDVVEEVQRRVAEMRSGTKDGRNGGVGEGTTMTVDLVAHSGGGSFIWGFLNSADAIPDYVQHIVFLDANYSFEDSDHHGEKLLAWLNRSPAHRLVVLAYDDRRITLNGKLVVSETGGTWRATDRMARFFEKNLTFQAGQLNDYQTSSGLDGRLIMARHPNPENKILHSVLVERNGFVYGVVEGRAKLAEADMPFRGNSGEEAYRRLVLP